MGQKLVVLLVAVLVPGGLIALVFALLAKRWDVPRRFRGWVAKRSFRSPAVPALQLTSIRA